MKYILDLKDKTTTLNDTRELNEIFYRYRIVDKADNELAIAWFTQKVDTGDVYCVSCRLLASGIEKFGLFFEVPLNGPFWPSSYYIRLPYEYVTEDNYQAIHTGTELVKNIADCIMSIFSNYEHKEGYKVR